MALDAHKSQDGRTQSLSLILPLIWDAEDRTSELQESCNLRFQGARGKFCTISEKQVVTAERPLDFESNSLDLRPQLRCA